MLENRIDQSQRLWDLDHPAMYQDNQDLLRLAVLYEGEHNELLNAWVGFLCDPAEATREDVLQEAADVILFITQLIHHLGSTVEQTVMDKRAYNYSRYTADLFKGNKPYKQALGEGKAWVQERDWKNTWYSIQPLVPAMLGMGAA